jgi:hypothetical protein
VRRIPSFTLLDSVEESFVKNLPFASLRCIEPDLSPSLLESIIAYSQPDKINLADQLPS